MSHLLPLAEMHMAQTIYPTLMSKEDYIISNKLRFYLKNLDTQLTSSIIKKDEKSLYLVCFRHVRNNNEDVLIYNYINYHPLFTIPMLYFILADRSYGKTTSEMGNLLFLINKDLFINDSENNKALHKVGDLLNDNNNRIIKQNFLEHKIKDYKHALTTMHELNLCCSNDKLLNLLTLAFKQKNHDFVKEVYKTQNTDIKWEINSNDNGDSNVQNNIINGCVLLTDDLNSLVEKLKAKGFNINQGPQRLRGQNNTAMHTLDLLDIDFRDALYYHCMYHYQYMGNITKDLFLSKDKFSYSNIHIRCGYVRY